MDRPVPPFRCEQTARDHKCVFHKFMESKLAKILYKSSKNSFNKLMIPRDAVHRNALKQHTYQVNPFHCTRPYIRNISQDWEIRMLIQIFLKEYPITEKFIVQGINNSAASSKKKPNHKKPILCNTTSK